MNKTFQFILSTIFLSMLISCGNDDSQTPIIMDEGDTLLIFDCGSSVDSSCPDKVIIDPVLFDSANSDRMSVNSLNINNDCLFINYASSGCDGSTFELSLLDSGYVTNQHPITRILKWNFIGFEICQAIIVIETSINLCPLKIPGQDSVMLQIEDSTLIYRY